MCVDGPLVALLHEQRHSSRVIDVRMTDHDSVYGSRIEGERCAVVRLLVLHALDQTTLQKNAGVAGLQEVERTRDPFRGPEKLQFERHAGSSRLQ